MRQLETDGIVDVLPAQEDKHNRHVEYIKALQDQRHVRPLRRLWDRRFGVPERQ